MYLYIYNSHHLFIQLELDRITYLTSVLDGTSAFLQAEALLLCQLSILNLKLGTTCTSEKSVVASLKKSLVDAKTKLDTLDGAHPVVYAAYYRCTCTLYSRCGPPELYYESANNFLAYSPYESMSECERLQVATNISIAALTGKNVFNFGELLTRTPILAALESCPARKWLATLLRAFARGDIDAFNEIVASNSAQYESQKALLNCGDYIKEKVCLVALQELIFSRASDEREIAFKEIAERTRLPLSQVEWLLMRSFSIGLVRGSIDEVKQTVSVGWIRPRILEDHQIATLKDRLTGWTAKVNETLHYVEDHTPHLFH